MALGIHKYFQPGDIVKNPDIWGDKQLFVVNGLGGNAYLPELYVTFFGRPKTPKFQCNFSVSDTKLVDSMNRPFRKVSHQNLMKLVKKKHFQATREFIIRCNSKKR